MGLGEGMCVIRVGAMACISLLYTTTSFVVIYARPAPWKAY